MASLNGKNKVCKEIIYSSLYFQTTKENLKFFEKWTSIKKEWKSYVLVFTATVLVWVINNPIYSILYGSSVATITYLLLLRFAKPFIGEQRWSITIFQTLLFWVMGNRVLAQDSVADNTNACVANGLFSRVTNFVTTVFSTIKFGGIAGGTLSNLICQVIGFMIVGLLLAFIGTIGRVAYQLGYEQQPLSAVINPVFGFLIFAGGVTVVTTVMLGTATT